MRLAEGTLGALSCGVMPFGYDRGALGIGVVHLGIGAFHRAHQAVALDDIAAGGDMRWGILGVSLRSPAMRDALMPQDGLYTLAVQGGGGEARRVIGAVRGVLVAPEAPAAVVAALARPDIHLVTLTVTEKGYHLAGAALDVDDPAIRADLADPHRPRTAMGYLVAGLAARRAAGLPGLTILSCDNLPGNGRLLGGAVLALADRIDPALARWIEAEAAFPGSMVDRIVPATTAADIDATADILGVRDEGLVKTEPFFQWVVEDRFAGPRPDLAAVGVTLVADVAPWERAKLRMLNGAHSAMAYVGGLGGIATVDGFVARSTGRAFVERLWDEIGVTLDRSAGLDLAKYRSLLLSRFANPVLAHRLSQIAIDGSKKLSQRLVDPLSERMASGIDSPAIVLAIAAWMRWTRGTDDRGGTHAVDDPLAPRLRAIWQEESEPPAIIGRLLAIDTMFPPALAADPTLRAALLSAWHELAAAGTTEPETETPATPVREVEQ